MMVIYHPSTFTHHHILLLSLLLHQDLNKSVVLPMAEVISVLRTLGLWGEEEGLHAEA